MHLSQVVLLVLLSLATGTAGNCDATDGSCPIADPSPVATLTSQIAGTFIRAIGKGKSDDNGQFNNPRGLALSFDGQYLLVVDAGNKRISVHDARNGDFQHAVYAPVGALPAPWGVSQASTGELAVVDMERNQVVVLAGIHDGTVVRVLGKAHPPPRDPDEPQPPTPSPENIPPLGPDEMFAPFGVVVLNTPAVVGADGPLVIVADSAHHRLPVFRLRDGALLRSLGVTPTGTRKQRQLPLPGEFRLPRALAVTSAGLVVVADNYSRRIQILTITGQVVSIIESLPDTLMPQVHLVLLVSAFFFFLFFLLAIGVVSFGGTRSSFCFVWALFCCAFDARRAFCFRAHVGGQVGRLSRYLGGLAVLEDAASDRMDLIVTDTDFHRIVCMPLSITNPAHQPGAAAHFWGRNHSAGLGPTTFNEPFGVAVRRNAKDGAPRLWVADAHNHRIVLFK